MSLLAGFSAEKGLESAIVTEDSVDAFKVREWVDTLTSTVGLAF